MKALLRRIRLWLRYQRWAPVNPPYRLAILNEGTPEVEARIDALKAMFGFMDEDEIGRWMNTSSPSLIASARNWGRS